MDLSFDPGTGVDQSVYAIATQIDGKVLIGGDFTTVNGQPRSGVGRLGLNGALDDTFTVGDGANDLVNVIVPRGGSLLLGGFFAQFAGTPRGRVCALTAGGALDASFATGSGADGAVLALGLQRDGRLLIGGGFAAVDGVARNGVARLNPDGTLDPTFAPDPGLGGVPFPAVNAIAIQPDGAVLIGGYFTRVNNQDRSHVARLNADGTLDATFDAQVDISGAGIIPGVYTIALQGDGMVLLGGDFNGVNGLARTNLARLKADGTIDPSFNQEAVTDYPVNALLLQPDGKILIGGGFTKVNGVARSSIARLNSDGTLDTSFDPGAGADWDIYALALQLDGKVLLGGGFSNVDGVPRAGIARLLNDISLPPARLFGPVIDGAGFHISLFTVAGHNYSLEYQDLTPGSSWTSLPSVPGTDAIQTLLDSSAPAIGRLYRVAVE